MKTSRVLLVTVPVVAGRGAAARKLASVLFARQGSKATAGGQSARLKAFAEMHPVDAHVHLYKNDPAFRALLERLKLHILDILLIVDNDPLYRGREPLHRDALAVIQTSEGQAALCTTFDPYKFADPDFADKAIHQLNEDFARGAVAVKIWKNVGMEIKKADGSFLLPDDPVLEPIYRDIADHGRTLIAHLADQDSCWQPPNPDSPGYSQGYSRHGYYQQHPEWYMYLHPDHPRKDAILAARDHLLEMNRDLRVVGAHLGSMETDVDQIAKHFDKYPNFAVDTSARVPYFMIQPRAKVRAFFVKYQDRILYATDLAVMPQDNTEKALEEWISTYERDWKFFATDQSVEYKGHTYQGLRLPESVLRKLYHANAVRWIPGILGTAP